MVDSDPEVVLPGRGIAARAVTFVLTVVVGALLSAFVARPLAATHFLWLPEIKSQDFLLSLRPKPPRHPDIIEVALNNQRRKLVNADGIPVDGRGVYAALIRRISADGAKVIVLDAYLPNRTSQRSDEALWKAMADTGKVFLPIKYDPQAPSQLSEARLRNLHELELSVLHGARTTVIPDAGLESYTWWKFEPPVWDFTRNAGGDGSAGVGMAVYQPDADGVLRHIQYGYLTNLIYPAGLPASELQRKWAVQNVVVPNEVVPAACRMFGVPKELVTFHLGRYIQLAGTRNPPVAMPMDEWGRAPISFAGAPGVLPVVNAADVLDGKSPAGAFSGKLVVIGVWGPFAMADNRVTPVSAQHPRMDITAQALNSILTRRPLVRLTHLCFVPLMFLAIVAGLAIPAPWRAGRAILNAILALAVYLAAAVLAASFGWLIPVFAAILLVLMAWLITMAASVAFPV
ncbi:MAG TPA: CHASE2 domain-containing protein [Armatimonadota bacterium]|jgi:CHASE2 domain-containing sensor protein